MSTSLRNCCVCALSAVLLSGCDVQVGDKGGVSLGIARGKAADEWVRTYTIPADGQLELVNADGAIEVTGADGTETEVRIVREAGAPSDEAAREALNTVTIVEDVTDGRVRVEVKRSSDRPQNPWGARVSVTYRVKVPRGTAATFRTENGPIRLEAVSGKVTASTTNGPIMGRDLGGGLTASAVNGPVQVAFRTVTEPVELTSMNGPIRLELAPDVKADLTAAAVNGGVTVDEQLQLAASTRTESAGTRTIAGALNGGGPAISARSINGGIRVMSIGAATSRRK